MFRRAPILFTDEITVWNEQRIAKLNLEERSNLILYPTLNFPGFFAQMIDEMGQRSAVV